MAEALLGVVAEIVLKKAISLAHEQISGVLGVREDLERLADTLKMIQARLADAKRRSTTQRAVEVWLEELEDAATDAEDLLDEFHYEVLKEMLKGKKHKVSRILSSLSIPSPFRLPMASRIKKINLKMEQVSKNANLIGLRPDEIMNSPVTARGVTLTNSFEDLNIVGRDDDIKILSQLTCSEDEKNLSVIGIVGMPGLGKTTLAQLLMKNNEVKTQFRERVWTCVSNDFSVDKVLKDMLQFLTGRTSDLTIREAIVAGLREKLVGQRFLLILDDVWSDDFQLWDDMNKSLQAIGGSQGSKIIVTTRNELVVQKLHGIVYRLKVLSDEASQKLFEKMSFGNRSIAKTHDLMKLSEGIVSRCGGVPQALKTIGGLLSFQTDEREWRRIESSIWSTLDGCRSAIKLSFNNLPSLPLKQCFAYCSIFPKGLAIKKKILVQQWMAHGLLNPSRGSDLEMEDMGNKYFKFLLQISLLQDDEFDKYDDIISCKMHDIMHDFALEASKGHCLTAKVEELRDDVKAAKVVGDESKMFTKLRTLHLPDDFSGENFLGHCKCEHLRVLSLADEGMEELPISIAKMKHLRYLDISKTRIRALPEFISKLYHLQTLRLPFVQNFPKDFIRLVNLRHLYINEEFVVIDLSRPPLAPRIGQIGNVENGDEARRANLLESLELVWSRTNNREGSSNNESVLEGLQPDVCLKSLTIARLENVASGNDARRANLSGKKNIESLVLEWGFNNTERSSNNERVLEGLQPHVCLKALKIVNFMGGSLPSWLHRLHDLTSMELINLDYCKQIPPLGHLPFLKVLYVSRMRSLTQVGDDFYGCSNLVSAGSSQTSAVVFPSLEELTFVRMSSLEEWSDMSGSSSSPSVELFPSLKKLEIALCPHLTRLPECLLRASTGLESLTIEDCDELVIPHLSRFRSLKYLHISKCLKFLASLRGNKDCRSLQTWPITCLASVMESLFHFLANLREMTLRLPPVEPSSNTTEVDIQVST